MRIVTLVLSLAIASVFSFASTTAPAASGITAGGDDAMPAYFDGTSAHSATIGKEVTAQSAGIERRVTTETDSLMNIDAIIDAINRRTFISGTTERIGAGPGSMSAQVYGNMRMYATPARHDAAMMIKTGSVASRRPTRAVGDHAKPLVA